MQLRTLGDQITQVKSWSWLPHSICSGRSSSVLEVVDEMTMVARRADESCAMVFSLTEEVQQREESWKICRLWS